LYQVRVTALATDRLAADRIHAAFAELFCLSPPEAEARLALLPLVVRRGLAAELAAKYVRVLRRLGLACEMVPDEVALDPGGPLPEPAQCGRPPAGLSPAEAVLAATGAALSASEDGLVLAGKAGECPPPVRRSGERSPDGIGSDGGRGARAR
jgi:hypothetical protein